MLLMMHLTKEYQRKISSTRCTSKYLHDGGTYSGAGYGRCAEFEFSTVRGDGHNTSCPGSGGSGSHSSSIDGGSDEGCHVADVGDGYISGKSSRGGTSGAAAYLRVGSIIGGKQGRNIVVLTIGSDTEGAVRTNADGHGVVALGNGVGCGTSASSKN